MKPRRGWINWAIGIFLTLATLRAAAEQPEVLIKWRHPSPERALAGSASRSILQTMGAQFRSSIRPDWDLAALPANTDTRAWLETARENPAIAHVEPNRRYHALATVNDRLFPRLYGLSQIAAPTAWDTTNGNSNVVIAIFDTGINLHHPDLAPVLWTNPDEIPGNSLDDDGNGIIDDVHGADFVDNDGDPSDDMGHGSHVAGTIAGAGNNQIGVAGIAFGCRILPVRILSADGGARLSDIVRAFDYVRALKARGVNVRLINNSWGGNFPSLAMYEAISACADAGILSICAAGNDFRDTDLHPQYPSAYNSPGVLSVAASDSCDLAAAFSNYGRRTVHLAAPGRGIYSCWGQGSGYYIASGTSMAAPHVTGAAALLLSRQPSLTLAQLRALLLTQSDARTAWTNRIATGARLNVGKAMTFLNGGSPVPTNDPPNPALTNSSRQIISRQRNGGSARDQSFSGPLGSSVSENGRYVVYASYDTNLAAGEISGFAQIYLRDTVSNINIRVSQTVAGVPANADCYTPVISRDGNFVAFVTAADNLVAGDNDDYLDVFFWERATRNIRLISFDPNNQPFELNADSPSISDDGAYVAFAGDTWLGGFNYIRDIYVWRRALNSTQIINFKQPSTYANDWSDSPSISGDGRFVAYHTWADNLVAGDTNLSADVHVYDRNSLTSVRLSRTQANQQANGDCVYPIISGDGNYVCFLSAASNLGQLPTNGVAQNYLVNRTTFQVTQVSRDNEGKPLTATNFIYDINHDGRFVIVETDTTQLPFNYGLRAYRPFIFDRLTGFQNVVAINDGGFPADDSMFYPSVSATGEYLVFATWANNMVAPDGNNTVDVIEWRRGTQLADLRVRPTGQTNWTGTGIIHPLTPQRILATESNGISRAEAQVFNAGLAATTFTFRAVVTPGWHLTVQTTNNQDVTVAVLAGTQSSGSLSVGIGYFLRLTLNRTNATADPLGVVRLSVRISGSTNDIDAVEAVATRSLSPPGLQLAARSAQSEPGLLGATSPSLDGNGQRMAFSSASDNLVPADVNLSDDVFVKTFATGELILASAAADGTHGNFRSVNPSLARNGNLVAFESEADNLVTNDTNTFADIFIKDLQTGAIELASLGANGNHLSRGSQYPILSGDGQLVLFESISSDVVPGDTNGCMDIFLRDRQSGAVECISRGSLGQWPNGDSSALAMSPDGRFILFLTHASNLSLTDTNDFPDIYLRDRLLDRLELISGRNELQTSDGHAVTGSISDDGRFVAFRVDAATDLPGGTNLILLDRNSGTRIPVVPQNFGLAPNAEVYSVEVSPNGALLALTAGDACGSTNASSQIWLTPLTGGAARVISATRALSRGTRDSYGPTFSGGGERIAFASFATNLVGEVWPEAEQVFADDTTVLFPDAALARTADGSWRGAGEIGTNQTTIEQPLAFNSPRDFYLRISDLSGFGGAVIVTGPTGNVTNWAVRYFSDSNGGLEITSSITNGWTFDPGSNVLALQLRVRVTILKTNAPASFTINVRSLAFPSLQENIVVLLVQDSDADGLADNWERSIFNNLTTAGAVSDFDGDGVSDLNEYIAGTDPKDAASALRLGVQPGALVLGPTHTNRFYQLESTAILGNSFQPQQTEQRGNGATLIFSAAVNAPPTNTFIRARADLP